MIRLLGIAIIIAIGVMLAVRASKAHSWYPWECCSGIDCSEIAASRVTVSPNGYTIDGTHLVPYSETRNSPDGAYHACFPKPNNLKCFFAPPPGS